MPARVHQNVAQLDFAAGMQRDAAPHLIDSRACFDCINGLFDNDGSVYKRGGALAHSTAAFGATGLRWVKSTHFDAGHRTVFANPDNFGVLDSNRAPVNLGSDGLTLPAPSALIESMLFIGGGYIYAGSRKSLLYGAGTVSVNNGSLTVTGTSTEWLTTGRVDPGMLLQIGGSERVYVVESVDSDTQLTIRAESGPDGSPIGYEGANKSGASYVLYNIYPITASDPYPAAAFYEIVANRLIYGEGNTVHVSERGRPHDFTADIIGGDPPSVETIHEIPEGVRITGLASIGQTLLVFTTKGIWAIDGLAFNIVDSLGNPQHRVQVLSRELILWGQVGIATWEQALIVPSMDGIWRIDGVSGPHRLSHPIDSVIHEYVERGYRPGGAAVEVGHGHYLLPVLSASGERVHDVLVCRLKRPVEIGGQLGHPWSHLAGHGARASCYTERVPETGAPTLLAADATATSLVFDCKSYWHPGSGYETDPDGTAPVFRLDTRDYETGNLTENVVRRLRTRYELVGVNAEVDFFYGFGLREGAETVWGSFNWAGSTGDGDDGTLYWEGPDEDVYFALDCPGPPSNGLRPHRCRVRRPPLNRDQRHRTRYVRIRIIQADACQAFRLRSVELGIRESRAVRR